MFLLLKAKTLFDFSCLTMVRAKLLKNKGYTRMKKISSYKFLLGTCLILTMLMSLVACENPNQATNASKTYFDLKGFIQAQIAYLKKNNPKVTTCSPPSIL